MGQPASVKRAIWLHWALVLLLLVHTVLMVVLREELIRAWAEGRPDIRRVLESQGLDAVINGEVRPPAFVLPAIVLFVVLALLIWSLLVFFANGYNWARLSLTALVFFLGVSTVAWIATDPPTVFVVLSVASFPLALVAVGFLWHRDTSEYIRGTWIVQHDESLPSP